MIFVKPQPNDNLGGNVCKLCAEKIYAFYEFRLSYLESEKKLREMLHNFETNQRLAPSCSDSVSSLSNMDDESSPFTLNKQQIDETAPIAAASSAATAISPTVNLECHECGRCFERELELRIHSHTHRKNETPSQNNDSQNGFDDQFLLANIKSEPVEYDLDPMEWAEVSQSDVDNLLGGQNEFDNDLRWKCTICQQRFLRRAHLRAHRRQHAVDIPRPTKVKGEKRNKDQTTKITIPQSNHDNIKTNINVLKKKPSPISFNLNVTADAQYERWQCKKCFSTFRTRRLLRDHNIVHRNASVVSVKFEASSQLNSSMTTVNDTVSSHFLSDSDMVAIDEPMPKVATAKKMGTTSPKSQSTPLKSDARWKCPKCRKVFETPKLLRKHKLAFHTFEIKLNLKSKNFISEKKNVSFELAGAATASTAAANAVDGAATALTTKKKQQQLAGRSPERDWPCNSCHQVFNRRR